MNDRKDVEVDIERELIDATSELAAARARLRDICRRYAGVPVSVKLAEPAEPGKKRRGGRRAKTETPAGAVKKEFGKKVRCVDCGTVTGSQIVGDKRMPLRHKNPASGNRCTGIFKEASLVTGQS